MIPVSYDNAEAMVPGDLIYGLRMQIDCVVVVYVSESTSLVLNLSNLLRCQEVRKIEDQFESRMLQSVKQDH